MWWQWWRLSTSLLLEEITVAVSVLYLEDDAWLLKQVLLNPGPLNGAFCCEVDVNVLAKAAGVVIPSSTGIAKG